MPRLPKWMADGMERVFSKYFHPVEIQNIQCLSAQMRKITFKGNFSGVTYEPGQVIEFRVTPTDFRHYTPYRFDIEKGLCEIVFYLNGKGIGHNWIKELKVGQCLDLIGPGGKKRLDLNQSHHFLFGDDTSIGLIGALTSHLLHKEYFVILELDEVNFKVLNRFDFEAEKVFKNATKPGQQALDLIETLPATFWNNWKEATFYLTGRTASIKRLRNTLINKGIHRSNIVSAPYWQDGKKGL